MQTRLALEAMERSPRGYRTAAHAIGLLIVACAGAAALVASAAELAPRKAPPPTQEDWLSHPEVQAIKRIVERHEAGIKTGRWTRREVDVCSIARGHPYALARRSDLDEKGRIRKYTEISGTDDSAYKLEHHFDEQGRLRFCLATAGAVNGASLEVRLYFTEDGARLWLDRRTSEEKYTFLPDWPEGSIVGRAGEALRQPTPPECSDGPPQAR